MPESKYVAIDGVRVHYVQEGSGTPVVLVHGLGASVVAWSANIGILAQKHAVYALDLPGQGGSEKPSDLDYDLACGVRMVVGFMDALGLSTAALVGNSMGGMVALRLAADFPERVSHLVLVSPAGLGRTVSWLLRLASLPVLGGIMHLPGVVTTRGLARAIFAQPGAIEPRVLEELKRARNDPEGKRAVVKALRSGVGPRGLKDDVMLTSALPRVKAPVLVIWGAQDRIIPVAHAYALANKAPQVQVEVFPGCGHWPQMEMPQQFNQLVLEFLKTPTRVGVDRE
ncbi:MAG: alpha/beta fold hydrolase [Chloroflexi bacterium]|nr:alpha/beta fold hydrolase [Chloroflexota bacterium]